jgi:hypothetical protein
VNCNVLIYAITLLVLSLSLHFYTFVVYFTSMLANYLSYRYINMSLIFKMQALKTDVSKNVHLMLKNSVI